MYLRKHVIGPPGTGKTQRMALDIRRALWDYDPEDILVVSFTRAAAKEAAERACMDIPTENISTVHAMAKKLIPDVKVIGRKEMEEWNEQAIWLGKKEWCLTSASISSYGMEGAGVQYRSKGDTILGELGYKLAIEEKVDGELLAFKTKWDEWKAAMGYIDFNDMLIRALGEEPPLQGRVLFVDEAQDLSKLQHRLVNHWANYMDEVTLYGDDDQCIYRWNGADPSPLIDPPANTDVEVLAQSYRVPAAVHERAVEFVSTFVGERYPKEYIPRDFDGFLERRSQHHLKASIPLLREARSHVKAGRSVMILATCNFMLKDVITMASHYKVPFIGRGAPMRFGALYGAPSAVWGFLRGLERGKIWTGDEMRRWAKDTNENCFKIPRNEVMNICNNGHNRDILLPMSSMIDVDKIGDLDWLVENKQRGSKAALERAVSMWKAGNMELKELIKEPLLRIDTIHQVKGLQADVVFLAPDISWATKRSIKEGAATLDDLARVFYVGMTRAKLGLVILKPAFENKTKGKRWPYFKNL